MKRYFTESVLESVAAPLKKNSSDTMRWIDNDCLYIGDLKNGVYFCTYAGKTLYAKDGYLFEYKDAFYDVIPTTMISVQPKTACAWGLASNFYRVFEAADKRVVAINSRDSDALIDFLGLQFNDDLTEEISKQLHIPKASF